MNGSKAVLDSNILIYFSKETLDFKKTCQAYKAIYISAISYMEVLGFMFKNKEERVLIKKFLNSGSTVINISTEALITYSVSVDTLYFNIWFISIISITYRTTARHGHDKMVTIMASQCTGHY